MATSIGGLFVDLSANSAKFSSDMGKATKALDSSSAKMNRALGGLGKGFSKLKGSLVSSLKNLNPLNAALGVLAGGAVFLQIAQGADRIQKLNQRLGVSTEALSQWGFVADLSGSSLDNVATVMAKLGKNVSDATNGLATPAQALNDLGLSAKKLKQLSLDQQFLLIGEAVSKVKNPADRTRIAMDLMGRQGLEMISIFAGGRKGIADIANDLVDFGGVLTNVQANDIAAMNDSVDTLKQGFLSLAQNLLASAAPAIKVVADTFAFLLKGLVDVGRFVKFLGKTVVDSFTLLEASALRFMHVISDEQFQKIKDGLFTNEAVENIGEAAIKIDQVAGSTLKLSESAKKASKMMDNLKSKAQSVFNETRTPAENFKTQMDELNTLFDKGLISVDTYDRAVKRVQDTLAATAEKSKNLTDSIADSVTANIQSADSWQDLGKVAINVIKDIVTQQLTAKASAAGNSAGGFFGNLFSGGGSGGLFSSLASGFSGLFGGGGMTAAVAHTGGIVGGNLSTRNVDASTFARAPRFHTGGIVGNEVPIIAKKGEGVFTKGQMKAMGGNVTVNMNISTPDAQSFRRSQGQIAAEMAVAVRRGQRNL